MGRDSMQGSTYTERARMLIVAHPEQRDRLFSPVGILVTVKWWEGSDERGSSLS